MLDSCQTSSPGHSLSGDGGGELKWSWSEVDKRGSLTPSSALHCGRHSCQSLAMAPAAVSLSEREHTGQCNQPETVGRQVCVLLKMECCPFSFLLSATTFVPKMAFGRPFQ